MVGFEEAGRYAPSVSVAQWEARCWETKVRSSGDAHSLGRRNSTRNLAFSGSASEKGPTGRSGKTSMGSTQREHCTGKECITLGTSYYNQPDL